MTEQFINDLKSSPYYERIFNGHDVIMIALTGSRLIDVVDERSDFDLLVVTNDKDREEYVDEFLTYYSKKVHWHYVPVQKLISNEDGNLLTCNGEVEFVGLCEQKIIYADTKYYGIIKYLIENKNTVALVGAYGLVRFHSDLIYRILSANQIKQQDYCKYIYHLCFASYVVLAEEPDKSFLANIKRIRWRNIPDEHKNLAVERIRLLSNYAAENPLDIKSIIYRFNQGISTMLN